MGEFRMPSLGADMETGTIIEWRVQPGDTVRRGDIVALVDTEKSDIEVEVFEDGVVTELLVEPGVEVAVGTPLALIDGAGASPVPEAEAAPRAGASPVPEEAVPDAGDARPGDAFVRASPLARRSAAAAGVDLGAVRGSGPGGAVVAADVRSDEAPAPR